MNYEFLNPTQKKNCITYLQINLFQTDGHATALNSTYNSVNVIMTLKTSVAHRKNPIVKKSFSKILIIVSE